MKQLLWALSVLVLAAQAARAQSSVTVYGVIDAGLVADRDSGKSTTRVESGQQAASRLGFRGSEELGGGMSAIFNFASFISADTGQLVFANRIFGFQSWVGLASRYGTIRAGRMFTPYFAAIDNNDPFDACGPGESTRVFADSGVRMDNTVKYTLPGGLHGFYGEFAYGAGEVAGNSAGNRQLSMNAGYAAGPVNLQTAYHATNDALGNKAARNHMVGGSYDFHLFKLWMALARSRNDTVLDTRDALIGVSVSFGASVLAADYVHKHDRFHDHADATQIAFGYYYYLSKRSNLYLVHSGLVNGSAASYQASVAGGARRLTSLGMRHEF
ncbi:porin [Duganella rhizosphaerae]|uniref:porin n=1 Tax=Duganella rhizosphaerae TaxID=2885763 RepID=UPI0030E9C91C